MLESQDIKLWQGVETDTVISRDSSPPLARRHLRRPIGEREKKKRLWMMGQRKLTGRMSDGDNGRRRTREMRGGEIYYTGGRRSALPEVWGSYRALRLCFLWKLNAGRVQSVTAEERTRISSAASRGRFPLGHSGVVCADFCPAETALKKNKNARLRDADIHPKKCVMQAQWPHRQWLIIIVIILLLSVIERRRVN